MTSKAERIDVRIAITLLALTLTPFAAPAAKERSQAKAAMPQDAAPCMTRPQLEALITYALPTVIEGVAAKCAGTLSADSYLRRSGPTLAARYRADSDRYWPVVRTAISTLIGPKLGGVGETMQKSLVSTMAGSAIVDSIAAKDCGTVNEAVELLSPLPAENLGRLTAMLAVLGMKDDKPGENAFTICPASGGR